MSNTYLTSVGAGQTTYSATNTSIGYGSAAALSINSSAGILFCNNTGISVGASISGTGILNCTGLTINGPLTCTSLIVPNAMIFNGLLTCNTGLTIASGTLNMNNNAITGVTSLNSLTLNGSTISGVTSLILGGKTINKIDFGTGNGIADSVTAASNPNVYRTITFPSGPFTSIPVVTCTATYPVTNYGPIIVTIISITTTNFTFACSKGYSQDNTFAQYTNVQWVAIN